MSTFWIRNWLPCTLDEFQLLYVIITEPTLRLTASRNGGRWIARSSASLSCVLPWSSPPVVPPSPMKCLAVASTEPGALSEVPCSPVTIVASWLASSGFSPNDSYVRPHRSLRATHRHGAKSQSMPVPETSSAVARPICCTRAGLRVAPRPMLCGKIVAPCTLLCPCTASTP